MDTFNKLEILAKRSKSKRPRKITIKRRRKTKKRGDPLRSSLLKTIMPSISGDKGDALASALNKGDFKKFGDLWVEASKEILKTAKQQSLTVANKESVAAMYKTVSADKSKPADQRKIKSLKNTMMDLESELKRPGLTKEEKKQINSDLDDIYSELEELGVQMEAAMYKADNDNSPKLSSDNDNKAKITIKQVQKILQPYNIVMTVRDGEYRVNFKGGKEATAYFTNDLKDALNTGIAMAKSKGVKVSAKETITAEMVHVVGRSIDGTVYKMDHGWTSYKPDAQQYTNEQADKIIQEETAKNKKRDADDTIGKLTKIPALKREQARRRKQMDRKLEEY
jgi:hypothetical protein